MKPNGQVAAAVVLACAVVGCNKKDSQKTKAAEQVQPRSAEAWSPSPKAIDGEGFVGTPAPVVKGPVSFHDGEAAYQAKNYGEATKLFEQYIARRPDNPWGHYMLGLSAWKSGDLVKSEQAFDAALRLDPAHMKSLVNLSRVLIEQKRYDDAIVKLTTAGEVDAESATVPRLLARAHSAKGDFDQAVDAYHRAIALDGSDAWSMNNLGMLYLEHGFVEDALAYLAKAVQMKENVAAFHNNLGMALEHQGRFIAAATAYKGALGADPGYKKAKQNLARVEAVKTGPEEPFDLAALAQGTDEERKVATPDETRASK
jgi:tetratricopeptide (TPR) repeat protein